MAINQCCWGAAWRKPTRLLANSSKIKKWGPNEWPVFDGEGFYEGPLKRDCGCQVAVSLAKKRNDEAFRTTGSSVYPPGMDEGIIADAIIQHCLDSHTGPPEVGEKRACVAEKADGVEENAEKKKKTSDCLERVPGKLKAKEATEETPGESMGGRSGQGPPMQCFYKGKHQDDS